MALGSAPHPTLAESPGRVRCALTENGQHAEGVLRLEQNGKSIASGSCAKALQVPAGTYTAVLGLDGALDSPEQRSNVRVQAGQGAEIRGDFTTGNLRIEVQSKGRRAAALATISRDGRQVASLAGGVNARLSTGRYDITVRYRDQEKTIPGVTIAKGQTEVVTIDF